MRHIGNPGRAIAIALTLTCLAVGAAPAADLAVERAVVATGVEDREPVGEATAFPADVGKVIFHTTFVGGAEGTTVEHVWSLGGEEKARVPLEIGGPRYRTWSTKSIPPEWGGAWTVAVVDDAGIELASVEFTVGDGE